MGPLPHSAIVWDGREKDFQRGEGRLTRGYDLVVLYLKRKRVPTSLSANIGPIWVHNRDTFSTQFFVWEKVGTFSVPGAFRDAEDVTSP